MADFSGRTALLWSLGMIMYVTTLFITSPHRLPELFWTCVFVPVTVSACFFVVTIVQWIQHRHDTNGDQAAASVPAPQEQILQPELREPPNTTGRYSFHISSLPTYLYDKDAIEGGLVCPICKDLFQKMDVVIQLPLCIHSFHKDCIELWLQRNLTCPVCRCRVDMEIPSDIALSID